MKLNKVYLLFILLLVVTGCGSNNNNNEGGISKEEWCKSSEDMPWSGCWREIARIDCETGGEFESDESIGELRLRSDGRYSVTWHPFETFTDYAGDYRVDELDGSITFDQINSPGFDGEGFYLIRENGDLELQDIWLGYFYSDADSQSETIACGYVFRSK